MIFVSFLQIISIISNSMNLLEDTIEFNSLQDLLKDILTIITGSM